MGRRELPCRPPVSTTPTPAYQPRTAPVSRVGSLSFSGTYPGGFGKNSRGPYRRKPADQLKSKYYAANRERVLERYRQRKQGVVRLVKPSSWGWR
jgi:hypothetical protein